MRPMILVALLFAVSGCRQVLDNKDGAALVITDTDNVEDTDIVAVDPDSVDSDDDGVPDDEDCDPMDPTISPDNPEVAYNGVDDDCDPTTPDDDLDGDGALLADDCDDGDPLVAPGLPEVCDGLDNDCNDLVDDAVGDIWYVDADGDGFGDPTQAVKSCDADLGLSASPDDCDDARAEAFPGADEVCNGLDDNCDLLVDNDAGDALTFYADTDDDGYGDPLVEILGCELPDGAAADATDCDDTDPAVHPNVNEVCNGVDDDCDGSIDVGAVDAQLFFVDGDGDGVGGLTPVLACDLAKGLAATGGDCDDSAASVYPGNDEVCDTLDNDCDGLVDEPGALGGSTYYRDLDGDGFGDPLMTEQACAPGLGWVVDSTDCDDSIPSVYPGATELCDGLDNDCDTEIDEGAVNNATWYADADGDGFGDVGTTLLSCTPPDGYVAAPGDCDDANLSAYPGATEFCDGYDNDCNGTIDENTAVDAETWWLDFDQDGVGGSLVSIAACAQPAGYSSSSDDCDDARSEAYPGADELCNGLDDNCNLLIDDNPAVPLTFYADLDGDGFGDADVTAESCEAPADFVSNDEDCNDASAAVRPGGVEICNGVDDDCDSVIDDNAIDPDVFYLDDDGDTYGDEDALVLACVAPADYVSNDLDCDDDDAQINPGALETCNGLDDDCDQSIDELAVDAPVWFADTDGDGFGNGTTGIASCTPLGTRVLDGTDCADNNSSIYPGADEVCDGLDNDCNQLIDDNAAGGTTWFADADSDGFGSALSTLDACSQPAGYVAAAGDCDDSAAAVSPTAPEVCNGLDDNCDGLTDVGAIDAVPAWTDADQDGFGAPGAPSLVCALTPGLADNDGDCLDNDASIYPGAVETCDGIDEDCNGFPDNNAIDAPTFYRDVDGDGFGNVNVPNTTCVAPVGFVPDNTDCIDSSDISYPGAPEQCDGLDNDCNGVVDDGGAAAIVWYDDADGDGFGDPATGTLSCSQLPGTVPSNTDCDDDAIGVNPAAVEICDGIDQDCSGVADDGAIDASTWYVDADDDGYGVDGTGVLACVAPAGTAADNGDCNDSLDAVNPGATEVCDGVDQDCDGTADNNAADASTWYRDADADGYGDAAVTSLSCDQPTGFVGDATDCFDGLNTVYPGAPELCDGLDNDCNNAADDGVLQAATWYVDADADGYGDPTLSTESCIQPPGTVLDGTDCDDDATAINPGAVEICDGLDNDCSGAADDNAQGAAIYFVDADSDGFGDAASPVSACQQPADAVSNANDCDDGSAVSYPGADEVCDGLDNDCDGLADDAPVDGDTWYRDSDGDGFGDGAFTRVSCAVPSGYVANDEDCLDSVFAVNPLADEVCDGLDNDCDGDIDLNALDAPDWYRDGDGDGFGDDATVVASCTPPSGFVPTGGDCEDADISISPAAVETCDGVDENCNAQIDEGAVDQITVYADGDGDGVGAGVGVLACEASATQSVASGDCDDGNAAVYPGAPEQCDGFDTNCDGTVDGPNPANAPTWFLDFDADGAAGGSVSVQSCAAPAGYLATVSDCDDGRSDVYPGAPEICDGVDNDCDVAIDEDVANPPAFYLDLDGDGFGDPSTAVFQCTLPSGPDWTSTGGDCNDAAIAINPAAVETCDGEDDNCDGEIDEASAVNAQTWYADADGDLFGNIGQPLQSCSQPQGYVLDSSDCDDLSAVALPGGIEVCDGLDNDCDGAFDESTAVDAALWFQDGDGDGYGVSSVSTPACEQPDGFAAVGGDCDDAAVTINPMANEFCDGVDNDCDGDVDESSALDAPPWYADADGDTYGDPAVVQFACAQPAGFIADNEDCDDTLANVNPNGVEVCDGLDNDCTGQGDDFGVCPCDVNYTFADGRPYMFCTNEEPWADARDFCASYGYHLLTVNDALENIWADGVSDTYSNAKWWIGLNDIAVEGTFVWDDGTPLGYTNWHPGEPNNLGSLGEDCTQFNRWGDQTWNDEPCSRSFKFICEYD